MIALGPVGRPVALGPAAAAAPARLEARIAFLLGDLGGGGVQRIVTILAGALAGRGARIDLLVCADAGELKAALPPAVTVVALGRRNPLAARLAALRADPEAIPALLRPLLSRKHGSRSLACLPALADYLRAARPDVLFAATPYLNIEAVLARRLPGPDPGGDQRAQPLLERQAAQGLAATPSGTGDAALLPAGGCDRGRLGRRR